MWENADADLFPYLGSQRSIQLWERLVAEFTGET
jgi:hypothetical protein